MGNILRAGLCLLKMLGDTSALLGGKYGDSGQDAAQSHGDVIDEVLASFAALEVDVEGPLIAPKAATWRLVLIGGELRSASYVPPPA